ncbi:MAG: ATP synthase subunit I [Thermotogota bacterium]
MKKKATKKMKIRVERPRKNNPDDSFATFVKQFVYGIILLNLTAVIIALLLSASEFIYGLIIGSLASFFYLWSLIEQRKRVNQLLKQQRTDKTPKGFVVRYSIMIVFLILSGIISVYSLFGTFYSLFVIRFILYYIAYKGRHD